MKYLTIIAIMLLIATSFGLGCIDKEPLVSTNPNTEFVSVDDMDFMNPDFLQTNLT